MLPQLFHVCAYKHLSELDKVAMRFIVYLNDTPRVGTTSDLTAIRRTDEIVGSDDGEGDFALRCISGKSSLAQHALCVVQRSTHGDFFVLLQRLLIFVIVKRRLEDSNTVVANIGKNLPSSV
jgi:hypothetical protein